MNTVLGLGYAQMIKKNGLLLLDCAHFSGLANGIMSKVLTGQADEPLTEDPDVVDTLTILNILLLRAQRPNWIPCFVSSYQRGLEIMWEHYLAAHRVCLRPVNKLFFRRNSLLVGEDAWTEVQSRAMLIVQNHVEQAKELWEQLRVHLEERQARKSSR